MDRNKTSQDKMNLYARVHKLTTKSIVNDKGGTLDRQ